MIRKLSILVLSLAAIAPAFAHDAVVAQARQIIALQNGETLYIFKDGKMAKENKYGRPVYLSSGEVVQTADGKSITTMGNEVARLSVLSQQGHQN